MSWSGQSWGPEQPRFAADLTGDGRADIVGFGLDGVWASLNDVRRRFRAAEPGSLRIQLPHGVEGRTTPPLGG